MGGVASQIGTTILTLRNARKVERDGSRCQRGGADNETVGERKDGND